MTVARDLVRIKFLLLWKPKDNGKINQSPNIYRVSTLTTRHSGSPLLSLACMPKGFRKFNLPVKCM